MDTLEPFKVLALAKEVESPENPGALERRVALMPAEVRRIVDEGIKVYVEAGAGDGLGISDSEYAASGATVQNNKEIYQNKEIIVKFKGPAMDAIPLMRPGTTLFCMAHFHSFPERAKLLEKHKINVVAMENILESPKKFSKKIILAKVAMKHFYLESGEQSEELSVNFLGWSERMAGAIRRAANRHPQNLTVWAADVKAKELSNLNKNSLFFFDRKSFKYDESLLDGLAKSNCKLMDLQQFEEGKGLSLVAEYFSTHKPFEFGMRRIHCLHETGQAGARYGFKLFKRSESFAISW